MSHVADSHHHVGAHRSSFPMSVVRWLRAGYPEGVPPKDRIPLVALLYRQLTPEQIRDVAVALAESAGRAEDPTITSDEIASLIEQITDAAPDATDIGRVAAVLAAAGWPLADPGATVRPAPGAADTDGDADADTAPDADGDTDTDITDAGAAGGDDADNAGNDET